MNNIERIPINIWDDFYEDGYVPENEIQETYAYVEDTDIPHDIRKECLEILLNSIKVNNYLPNVEMTLEWHDTINDYDKESVKRCIEAYGENFFFKRWEIKFKNITHEMLYELVEILDKNSLTYNNIPFEIYSES